MTRDERRRTARSRWPTLLASIAVIAALTTSSAEANVTLTFEPTADSHVRADRPNVIFGTATSLRVDDSPVFHTLMKFTVSGVGGDDVTSATLRLYAVSNSTVGGSFFRTASTSWSESTVNWNTAPAADPTPVASVGRVVSGTWYDVDLSSLVTGDGTYGLRVTSTSTKGAAYTSKEGTAGFRPELAVVTAPSNDTTPPTAPGGLSATPRNATTVDLSWTASTDDVGVHHYEIIRDGSLIGTATSPSFADTTAGPSTTYTYTVVAYDATGNASPPSGPATVTTPAPSAGFSFAAAGDHGANAKSAASLAALDTSGASFYLALGDMDYGETPTDEAWCDYVKAGLPTLGSAFPFQLVSGNHEQQGGTDGYILNHAACLPDRMGSTSGPGSLYGAEYSFDYPAASPLARVIMISPNLTIENVTYTYAKGTTRYQWLAGVIDDARTAGIPWVVVGMHEVCLSAGRYGCDIGTDLMNLLVEKEVDLVLQGHDHNYQRSKQLALDPATCPEVPVAYAAGCVIDDGSDDVYPKGTGSIFVIDGVFGKGGYTVSESDPQAPYFARIDSSLTTGFTLYTVTDTRIVGRFVNSTGGFTDAFEIVAGATPAADRIDPTMPTNLQATAPSTTRVDLTWTPSSDDIGIDHYSILRDGVWVGSSTTASYADQTASPGATYSYAVRAHDAAGNMSGLSDPVTVAMPGVATTLTFVPVADATLKSGSPATNFGAVGSIEVDGSPIKDGLLKFTVSGAAAGVARAVLRLHAVDGSDMGGVFSRVADSSWSESTVTWNTAPTADPTPVASLGRVVAGTWYEVDLTPMITGDGTYTIRISSISTNGADYASKEGTQGLTPQLVLTLS